MALVALTLVASSVSSTTQYMDASDSTIVSARSEHHHAHGGAWQGLTSAIFLVLCAASNLFHILLGCSGRASFFFFVCQRHKLFCVEEVN